MMKMPIGTLIRNASRQEMTVSAPPSTRPSTEPSALHGGRHRHRLVAGVTGGVGGGDQRQTGGAATAAPTPWTARAAISVYSSSASPQTSEAMVNIPTP